ncbi:MAG: BamA/TamA family outer membrane protein [Bacteroidales bacterium]|jgi:outer membrane protein assembly factor BamA|nr:BamA/TamA family outer membrane protein [Bacteroidales bacterium]MCI2144769.1 BamA/TamA family outer membrane protein [Bacteroidales bacterium]
MKSRFIIPLLFLCAGCSTTKLVPEGEHRLKENKIIIENSDSYSASDLNSFLKQKAGGRFSLPLWIYNWGNNSGSAWDKCTKKAGKAPVIYDSTAIFSTEISMLSHLEFLGYYNSNIRDSVAFDGKNATQYYFVTLGKQFHINKINYTIRDSILRGLTKDADVGYSIHRGDILSEKLLETESSRLSEIYRNHGYWGLTKYYFFFYADTTAVRDSAALYIRLEDYSRNEAQSAAKPHIQYHFRQISIIPTGGLKVRSSFTDQINRLKPGTLYSEEAVNNTYERFASVPLFQTVNLQLSESDSSLLDCSVLLTPSKLQSIKFNLEASVNSSSLFGISPSFQWSHKNIFGGGELLSLGFMGNFQFMLNSSDVHSNELGVSANLAIPKFLFVSDRLFPKNLPKTEFNLTYNYQNRPEYKRNILSSAYGYSFDVGKRYYFQIYPLQASIVQLANVDEDWLKNLKDPFLQYSYKNHFDLGSGAVLYYTSNPNGLNISNLYTRYQIDVAGNIISLFNKYLKEDESSNHLIWGIPYAQYFRNELSLVYTCKFGETKDFAVAGRILGGVGFSYGNSTTLPFERLFWAGGANSLRGWQARSVGPGTATRDTTFKIANQTGDMRLEGNIEFRFPIYSVLRGAVFFDAGNVWNLPKTSDSVSGNEDADRGEFSIATLGSSIAMDYGLGVRINLSAILIRMDFGIQLYDPSQQKFLNPKNMFRDDACALHFGIGLPF